MTDQGNVGAIGHEIAHIDDRAKQHENKRFHEAFDGVHEIMFDMRHMLLHLEQ